jgi:hypothetical protein
LKTKCRNYQLKKAATFSRNDVCKFLLEAADQEWILQKVVLMMGIFSFLEKLVDFQVLVVEVC